MKFLLDLATLLLVLGGRKQSGEVSTEFKRLSGIPHKGPFRACITLIEGNISSCVIQSREGRILMDGKQALRELEQVTQHEWSWSPASRQARTLPIAIKPSEESEVEPKKDFWLLIPRHTLPLESIDKNTLPRKHWQVLLLINGSRTIAQIAASFTPFPAPSDLQKLIDILKDLQGRGFIVVSE